MEKKKISGIIKKYLSNRFSPETEEKLQKWIIKNKDIEEKEKASQEYWGELEMKSDSSTIAALERVNLRIGYNKEQLENVILYHKFARFVAVIIPLCLLAGGLFYFLPPENELIKISAAYGEQKRLVLPDDSEVWLNAGSTITFPESFGKDKRLVTLNGEACFSVKKDTLKPFIVETPALSVKVLGTKFIVKAYSDEEYVTATLISGKVEVNVQSQHSRMLRPNEQLIYDKKTSSVEMSEIDAENAESWIIGRVIFINATPDEIFRTLERRYNSTIENMVNIPSSKRYTVKFLKNESLDEMLNILADIIGFDYQKNGNHIILTNK